jgi:uncharacterized protein YndB with AHSA1/START domain
MEFLTRLLKFAIGLLLSAVVVAWFAARRGDRGYIEEEVTIDRPAPSVFRWLTSEDLLRRWISGLVKLERTDTAQSNATFRIDELIASRRVMLDLRIMRVVPNQEIEIAVSPVDKSAGNYASDVKFKLLPSGEFASGFRRKRIFEPVRPILSRYYLATKKLREIVAPETLWKRIRPRSPPCMRGTAREAAKPQSRKAGEAHRSDYQRSIIPAAPIPPPIHMVTIP